MPICADAISETTELAASYTRSLDTLNGLRRVEEIRTFRALDYEAKKAYHRAHGPRAATPAAPSRRPFFRVNE